MEKRKLCFLVMVLGTLGVASVPCAQTQYRVEERKPATPSVWSDRSLVRIYGPDALTELAAQAIHEKRPHVGIERYRKALKNQVWIEGTTGADYMPLSRRRVDLMRDARARGESVFAALCNEQKGIIEMTVGMKDVPPPVEREYYRTEIRRYYVGPMCPLPPPPAVFIPAVNAGAVIGAHFPVYGYGSSGGWWGMRRPYHAGGRAFRSIHPAPEIHSRSGPFHRGYK
jgi:hypothetical protein